MFCLSVSLIWSKSRFEKLTSGIIVLARGQMIIVGVVLPFDFDIIISSFQDSLLK